MLYLLFGHLFGDYFLQNSWMAYYKKTASGFLPCFVHCTIYTTAVCSFLAMGGYKIVPTFFICIFLSHWVLDRYEVISWWASVMGIRTWSSFKGELHDPALIHQVVTIAFGAIVYVVMDNSLHLFLMWLIIKYFFVM